MVINEIMDGILPGQYSKLVLIKRFWNVRQGHENIEYFHIETVLFIVKNVAD